MRTAMGERKQMEPSCKKASCRNTPDERQKGRRFCSVERLIQMQNYLTSI